LAGDPLNLTYAGGGAATLTTINTRNDTTLNLGGTLNGGAHVVVDIVGQLALTANIECVAGTLTFIGGSIDMVGASTFRGVTFDSNLIGTGTINADHGGDGEIFGPTVFNGSVGYGIIVALESQGPPEFMQIAHPSEFAAKITIPEDFFGSVLFEGLHVTRADLTAGDVLQMWNGRHLVDTVRLGGDTNNLVVQQSASGVSLTSNDLGLQHVVGNLLH
jgi:hypothetical protein